jgi:Lar family restriction alleviation protein
MSDDQTLRIAARAVQLYAETHPRPTQVTQAQVADGQGGEMKEQDDMSERELLPCPFCNGVPAIHAQMVSRYQFVSCSRCNCDGPLKERTSAAIAAWNRRSPSRQSILEEAAKVADVEAKAWSGREAYACAEVACENIAAAIRSLSHDEKTDKEKGDE